MLQTLSSLFCYIVVTIAIVAPLTQLINERLYHDRKKNEIH